MEYDKAKVASSSSTFVTIDFEENIHDQRKMNTQNIFAKGDRSLEMLYILFRYLNTTLKIKP